jgi:hypothetical protein
MAIAFTLIETAKLNCVDPLAWLTEVLCRIPEVLVKMRVGGESNRSLEQILRKSREDERILRQNGVGGVWALDLRNTRKIGQFLVKT